MKHAPGLYRRGTVFWYARQINGKRTFISLETSDIQEATRKIALLNDNPLMGSGGALPSAVDRFLAYRVRQGEYSESTVKSKGYVLKVFGQGFAHRTLASVTLADVQGFYDEARKGSDSTANGYLMLLRAFFRWSVETEKVRRDNPAAMVRCAKISTRARTDFCSPELRDRLISECTREDLRFVLFCGFHAGLRFNEIVEAKAFWFDLPNKLLHLRKHDGIQFKDREERTIPMTSAFAEFVAAYGLREPYMLRPDRTKGKSIYRYDFGRPFDLYVAEKGVPWVTPHIMRHTFASLLASAGVSIFKVSQWLGDDVRVTQRHYAKLSPGDTDIERAFH